MNKFSLLTLISFLFFFTDMSAQRQSQVDVSVFPVAETGKTKYIINIPEINTNDSLQRGDVKIEFYVGKTMKTDNCNTFGLMGNIMAHDLKGYGYTYYEFTTTGDVYGTLKGCLDSTQIDQFVSAKPFLVDYNPLLPIVIYVPEGYEVRYKIFKNNKLEYSAENVT